VLSINSNTPSPSTPFGGFKQSGFGRELGMHALAGYSEVKKSTTRRRLEWNALDVWKARSA